MHNAQLNTQLSKPCAGREHLEQERTTRAAAEAQLAAAQAQTGELQADVRRLTGLAVSADGTVQDYVSALQVTPAMRSYAGHAHPTMPAEQPNMLCKPRE